MPVWLSSADCNASWHHYMCYKSSAPGFLGYDIGATSGALESLKSATASGTDW